MMKNRDETQVLGALFLSFGQACVNFKFFIAEETRFLEHIRAEEWYSLEKFSHILQIIREKYSDPAPILEQIGIEMMQLWYAHGPGKHIIQRGVDFLHFQTSSEGYYSVIRGEPEHIGDFSLLSLDEEQGTATVQSTTPLSRDMERGVLIGGLGVVRDLLYIDVDNTENEDIFRIRFRGVQKVYEKKTLSPAMPEDVDVTTLYWKHKMLEVTFTRHTAFWNATNDTLSQAFEQLRKQGEELQERTAELLQANALLKQEIAERKRVEEELRHAKDVAEEAQRSAEAAQKASEAANRTKSVFLANMSHELRTPLNAVLGYAQILARSQTLSAEDKEHLNTISRSGEHLLALINDVLELSKIDADRVELQPVSFDLHQMLADLDAMFRLRAKRKGLALSVEYTADVPAAIRADQGKLRQILINLLGNAVKYTKEGGVTLRILDLRFEILDLSENSQSGRSNQKSQIFQPVSETGPVSGQAQILKFTISDTGIGIAPADLERVFNAFVQVGDQQYQKGTGLGLPISQRYVRMMGGDIHVDSEVGKGSTFSFTIPVELIDQSSIVNQQSSMVKRVVGVEPGQSGYRLLIVEDEADNRTLLMHMLKLLGFNVCEAQNGEEAVALWHTWQPHLIWMDMRMPVMDGYTATRKIRRAEEQKLRRAEGKSASAPAHEGDQSSILQPVSGQASILQSSIPIIALTASAFEEDRAKVLEAGCDDFVRKPFRETEIFDMLHKHLGVRFVYESDHQPSLDTRHSTLGTALAPEALATLPEEWLTTLEHGARETNTTLLFKVIEQIRPQNAAMAGALADLTNDFAYDTILTILHQAGRQTVETGR